MTIRVFLADDHAVVREGLRAYLDGEQDIEVVGEAGNGRDALAQVAETVPDVAVIDVAMPDINGIEATERMGRICPETQVVILSMHSTNEYVFRALQAGAKAYVLKESAGKELINAVHAVQRGHHYLSPKVSDQLIVDYVKQREAAKPRSPLAALTAREQQILRLLAEGAATNEIATALSLSRSTVNTYRSRLMRKLDISDLASLIRFAMRHGVTEL
ncbi:MAG: response regulator transcription factor [Anaerolineae bacterium]|jgi:DNA-binding NarL/FixJ family response regulator